MELLELLRGSRKRESRNDAALRIQEERRCILTSKSDFFIREAYKTLRTNVTFALAGEGDSRVIVVTSSLQSEGKSITAINLALSFAEADKKVLLVDCDLRRPKIGRLLSVSSFAGLSNLLLDPSLIQKPIFKKFNDIDVLLSGDIPPNPSELLGSARMKKLLDQMREKYDCIILDTPPINMVTDAVVLAPQTDGVLFVVRANQSERGAVIHAVDQLEYTHAKLLGFVLNGIDLEKTSYGYGKYRYRKYKKYGYYGSRYGYGYGYGSQPGQKQATEQVEQ